MRLVFTIICHVYGSTSLSFQAFLQFHQLNPSFGYRNPSLPIPIYSFVNETQIGQRIYSLASQTLDRVVKLGFSLPFYGFTLNTLGFWQRNQGLASLSVVLPQNPRSGTESIVSVPDLEIWYQNQGLAFLSIMVQIMEV